MQVSTRVSAAYIRHLAVVFLVFGITGISAVLFSRLLLNNVLGLEGSLWSGPWTYRVIYALLVPPFYFLTLVVVGTLFGKQAFFKRRVLQTWGRLLPKGIRARLE